MCSVFAPQRRELTRTRTRNFIHAHAGSAKPVKGNFA
jgi:hypothetical protein